MTRDSGIRFGVKVLKVLKIPLIFFTIVIGGHVLFEQYIGFDDEGKYNLPALMNHAFGLPGKDKPYFVKSDGSVFNFDKKNLFKYQCKPWKRSEEESHRLHVKNYPELSYEDFLQEMDKRHLAYLEDIKQRSYRDLSLEEIEQLQCVEFSGASRSSKDAFKSKLHKELCSNRYVCKIKILLVNSYVLEAGLLPKIVKILERPCDYIAEPRADMSEWDKRQIESLKGSFRCEKTWSRVGEYKYTLLEIVDYENKENYNVVVERKDIK
jgi:hypothetical protein